MTLRDKIRTAIEGGWQICTVEETHGVPPDSSRTAWESKVFNADEAAGRVMEALGPLISAAIARLDALAPRLHRRPDGAEFLRCEGCGASVPYAGEIPVPGGRIAHEPNCQYIKIHTALCVAD